ncbi:aminoglycoside phosphotransferase family protein [Microbacterium sp. NPDC058389]|uniref:aminoglycoside phosphotransferase family protein n=1 Tax=Microbacterium sp. NPDC058389 TaxID=3346475 RepID=UPI00366283E3
MHIDAALVSALVAEQFPHLADLPVRPVPRQGWDNRTFRLGDELTVRLPSAEGYAAAVEKEERALRFLDGRLPVSVPGVVAVGAPGPDYPFPWSVRRWLPGDTVAAASSLDQVALAEDVGGMLAALRALPTHAGAAAGRHSFYRGSHPSAYSDQVQTALERLDVDAEACAGIWLTATTSAWECAPVWFHGDVAVGNLLTLEGRLSAVIDFGTCGVGDPACDLVLAWTHFRGEARTVFREAAGLDDATWRRARGWALWKSLVVLSGQSSPDEADEHRRILAEVLADPVV